MKNCKVRFPDHTGDSVVAEFDQDCMVSMTAARAAITATFDSFQTTRNADSLALFGRPNGADEMILLPDRGRSADLTQYEELLIQRPIVGG